ncbi:hypothetical protein ACFWMR_06730 [Amycolatopsis thailandensis]|uniref:Peptidase inhibitor family I36 n=1 Tax=Amycolatopsis thailandensis TaxID=589330 RepID=A0A229REL0_9PSEU|nr:hypothetical protein [Amycolatopsis thailandensis]OXM45090.1 hypothetical protein CFP71_39215 [Amycolatopsis thailandensis]
MLNKLRYGAALAAMGLATTIGTPATAQAASTLVAERHCAAAAWCDVGFYSYGGPLVIESDVSGGANVAIKSYISSSDCFRYGMVNDAPLNWACQSPGYGDRYALVGLADENGAWQSMYIKVYRV